MAALGFDAILSNSVLHHLADPTSLWCSVRTLARPDAAILIMDLLRPASEDEVQRLANCYAWDAPPILRRDFECSLRAAYLPHEVEAQLNATGLGGLTVTTVSDRHWIAYGRVPK